MRYTEKVKLASGLVAQVDSLTALESARIGSKKPPADPPELLAEIERGAEPKEIELIRMQLRLADKVAPYSWNEDHTAPLFGTLWQAIEQLSVGDLRALSDAMTRASLRGSEDSFRGNEREAAGVSAAPDR